MIPVYQQFKHDPANGIYGDCMRASLASVLNLPIEDVPHFARDTWDETQQECVGFFRAIEAFLNPRGLHYVLVAFPVEFKFQVQDVIERIGWANPNTYYLAGVGSPRGFNHSVVCIDGVIVHDPFPSEDPIEMDNYGPMSNGAVDVLFLVPTFMHADFDHAGNQHRAEAIAAGHALANTPVDSSDVVDADPCEFCGTFDCASSGCELGKVTFG